MQPARLNVSFSGLGIDRPALVACVLLAAGVVSDAAGQCEGDWTQAASGGPSIRSYHGLAFDGARGTTVL